MDNDDSTLTQGVVERTLPDGHFSVRLDGTVRVCHVGPILRRVGVTIREGDRVTVRTESDGIFRGEITQVRSPLEPAPRAEPQWRASLLARGPSALQPKDQKIDRTVHPDWATGADRLPVTGDEVYCTAGLGTVLRVLGRTGNGSRLIEIRIPGRPRASFFAAASNILIMPSECEVEPGIGVLEL